MNNSENNLIFSIIIPVQEINDYVSETCGKLAELENKNFEIIIFPDSVNENNKKDLEIKLGARIISTGNVSPSVKRDGALKYANGKYLAFIDDDAYPNKDWLTVAEKYLKNPEVAAIGGPQLTPPDDSFRQKVSGAVFLSPLSGSALIRYWHGKKVQEVEDWPTVNFIIKKEAFAEIGGFDSHFWPGEDTKLCLDILNKVKKKILYIPELAVYHHRRSGLRKHLKQIGNYGLHRGYFALKLPQTSRKIMYFIPSIFVIFLFGGALASYYEKSMLNLYLFILVIYILALIISAVFIWKKTKFFFVSLMTIPYLALTHLWYGIRFIQGFVFTKELKSKLGK